MYNTSHRPEFRAALLRPRYWLVWLLMGGNYVLAWVPPKVLRLVARIMTPLVMGMSRNQLRVARTNLAACFPERSADAIQHLLHAHFLTMIHSYLSYGRLMFRSASTLAAQIEVSGLERVEALAAAGNGIILLAPHTVAFEFAGQGIVLRHAVVSVARVHATNEALDWLVSRYRNRFGGVFFDNRSSMLPLIKAVRSGAWMYYLPDEDRRDAGGEFAPFFGIPKLTIPTLGRLTKACRAQVIPVTARLDSASSRFLIELGEPIEGLPAASPAAEAAIINQAMERIIRTDPAQYGWTTRMFRTRPPGVPLLYGR